MFDIPSTLTITELTQYIRELFASDSRLGDVWVTGEVSNMRRAASGHCYFTLKDGGAELKCVLFRTDAQRQTAIPRDGDSIMAHGSIQVYVANGVYQLYVDRVRPVGVGDLYLQFEQLKQKLASEGLFDEERKRPLPLFPHKIGIVTSADAAAFQDVQNVLRRRYPLVEVILAPTLVQGADAPPKIVAALKALNQRDDLDAILVCRGGGSIEDLWAFNDERVARAIVASKVPVVSGVGHETDFTIADFAADLRAPTPSAAAELLTPDSYELRQRVLRYRRDLDDIISTLVGEKRRDLEDIDRTLKRASPAAQIRAYQQRLDDWNTRMIAAQRGRLAILRERLLSKQSALVSASPQAILNRGYAMVRRAADQSRVNAAADLRSNESIILQFHDGERKATSNSS
jgi:exodeoxyribonuclease VII large subunit